LRPQRGLVTRYRVLSVVIATKNCERALVRTLAMLVAGAAAGLVREVILADGGSTDATVEVGDIAGCEILVSPSPAGARLTAAVAKARAPWLMLLRPGVVLDPAWVDETTRSRSCACRSAAARDRSRAW
jgi:hypothetical protein